MNVVLLFIVCYIVFRVFRALVNKDYERDLKRKKNKAYPPATYSLQKAGRYPKDDEFYYWERKERERGKRRAILKRMEKEWKKKGKKPWWK